MGKKTELAGRLKFRADVAKALVRAANALSSPLLQLAPGYQHLKLKNDRQVSLECTRADGVSKELRAQICELMKSNMMSMYVNSSWGWNEENKMAEILSDKSWILTCYESAAHEFAGFVHFRFEVEHLDCRPVLYVYEIQISSPFRALGLGSILMKFLQEIATKTNMFRVMLTTFLTNVKARQFFESQGFIIDLTDPSKFDRKEDYVILSRNTKLT